jgi:hypothetical protein
MMDAKDKAMLVFHYLANGQSDKALAIEGTVAIKNYDFLDLEFTAPLSCGYLLAKAWGNTHWKNLTFRMTSLTRCMAEKGMGNTEGVAKFAADHLAFENRLLAIDAALVHVCRAYGIDPDDVRKIADDAIAFEPTEPAAAVDVSFFYEMVEKLTQMIESWPINTAQKSYAPQSVH